MPSRVSRSGSLDARYPQAGGDVDDIATVREYPRRFASVWDLVARCIAAGLQWLNGPERLLE